MIVTLTDADTAYAVPSSSPAYSFSMTVWNGSDTNIFWGFENTNTNGILMPPGSSMILELGSTEQIYAYCASAGKVLTYTVKEIV